MKISCLLFLIVAFCACSARLAFGQIIFIKDVSIIDAGATNPVRTASIIVENGIIKAIGRNLHLPPGAHAIDGSDKFVLPGLWDMHAHLAALTPIGIAPEHYVGYGVLHVRDMGGRMNELLELRRSIKTRERIGPEIIMAGYTLNSEQPSDFHRKVVTDTEARAAVRELKAAGVDFIKIHRAINREVFFALADETNKQGLALSGHVPLAISWIEGSNAGMRTIEHIQTVFENLEPDARKIAGEFDNMIQRLTGSLGDSIFHVLKSNHTYFDPTLIGYQESYAKVAPDVAERRSKAFQKMKIVAAKIYSAGVPIVTGTDVLYDHGHLLLKELKLLESIGMSRQEVLKAATVTSAEAAQRPDLGVVMVGSPASFIILDKNPMEDLANLETIHAIILGNQVLDQDSVKKLRTMKE
jgi:predicted amidohydrolase